MSSVAITICVVVPVFVFLLSGLLIFICHSKKYHKYCWKLKARVEPTKDLHDSVEKNVEQSGNLATSDMNTIVYNE
jgi:thioredoxin-related protein